MDRFPWSCLPASGGARPGTGLSRAHVRRHGWSSPDTGPSPRAWWRMHIRAGNGGDAREGINDHVRRPARPPALDQQVESPALNRADRCDRTTSAACRACTRLP